MTAPGSARSKSESESSHFHTNRGTNQHDILNEVHNPRILRQKDTNQNRIQSSPLRRDMQDTRIRTALLYRTGLDAIRGHKKLVARGPSMSMSRGKGREHRRHNTIDGIIIVRQRGNNDDDNFTRPIALPTSPPDQAYSRQNNSRRGSCLHP
jgi:hypothetical protein